MPLLAAEDPLPACPRRVLAGGTAGSGKTTLAARVGELLHIPHVEIDALFHGPDWTPRPTFDNDVRRLLSQPARVTEWQYRTARPLLAAQADPYVWLDLSRSQVMRQVTRRTVGRRLRRQVLWSGNLEPPLWSVITDHEHILRWAWTTHGKTAERVAALRDQRSDLPVVRLPSRLAVQRWTDGPLRRAATCSPE